MKQFNKNECREESRQKVEKENFFLKYIVAQVKKIN